MKALQPKLPCCLWEGRWHKPLIELDDKFSISFTILFKYILFPSCPPPVWIILSNLACHHQDSMFIKQLSTQKERFLALRGRHSLLFFWSNEWPLRIPGLINMWFGVIREWSEEQKRVGSDWFASPEETSLSPRRCSAKGFSLEKVREEGWKKKF